MFCSFVYVFICLLVCLLCAAQLFVVRCLLCVALFVVFCLLFVVCSLLCVGCGLFLFVCLVRYLFDWLLFAATFSRVLLIVVC